MEFRGWWRLVPLSGLIAFVGGCMGPDLRLQRRSQIRTYEPAAYRMPAAKGMADLRLAMVHDVLCERYRRHGPAWDRAARAAAEARIAAAPGDLDAYDDAAMAAERLDERTAAERLLRQKAELQGLELPTEPVPLPCRWQAALQDRDEQEVGGRVPSPADAARYRTLANLGTVLLHAALPRVLRGDAAALPMARQGLACLQASVRIDPSAHFGRERWQIVAVEHLLAAARDPGLLKRFDLIGDPIVGAPLQAPVPAAAWRHTGFAAGRQRNDLRFDGTHTQAQADAEASAADRFAIRQRIPRIGADPHWVVAVEGSRRCDAAFDQPVLGILGMWTLGGGASPHFALCLATAMERVGQGSLAWEAYERTAELAAKYSPDPAIVQWLAERCRDRQAEIASTRGGASWEAAMRAGMAKELAWALALRKEYHAWEEARLARGGLPVDAAAEEAWWSAHPPLGSPTGTADERHAVVRDEDPHLAQGLLLMIFAVGVSATLASLLEGRPRRDPSA